MFAYTGKCLPVYAILEALSELRHDIRAELLEEAALVVPGGVEGEVVEAEPDVPADLLDHLVGVVRDDEACVRAVGGGVGEALHLDRVLDAALLLGRQRERGPPAARVEGELGVVVVGDLDLDELRKRRGVAAGLLGALGEIREQLLVELLLLAARRDEAVTDAAGQLRGQRS